MSAPRLACAHTHLFRGARLRLPSACLLSGPVELGFSDGVLVPTTLSTRDGGGLELAVPAYRTGRGTTIAGKRWLMAEPEPGRPSCASSSAFPDRTARLRGSRN